MGIAPKLLMASTMYAAPDRATFSPISAMGVDDARGGFAMHDGDVVDADAFGQAFAHFLRQRFFWCSGVSTACTPMPWTRAPSRRDAAPVRAVHQNQQAPAARNGG